MEKQFWFLELCIQKEHSETVKNQDESNYTERYTGKHHLALKFSTSHNDYVIQENGKKLVGRNQCVIRCQE